VVRAGSAQADDLTLAQACVGFLEYLAVERNLTPHSLTAYGSDLRQFQAFCASRALLRVAELSAGLLSEFLQSLAAAGRRPSTQARVRVSLRQLFFYLQRQKLLGVSPAADLVAPRQVRQMPRVLGESEAQRLMQAASGSRPRQLRDRAILEVLYGSGLRVSELCALQVDQVDLDKNLLQPTGKGRKERLVPLGQAAAAALQVYFEQGRPQQLGGRNSKVAFVGNGGKPISRMGIYNMVRRYGLLAAIDQPVSPHKLRHAFATHLVRGGADLRSVQQLLGHACIATTEIYTHVVTDELRAAVQQHHPLGRLPTPMPPTRDLPDALG
jgi:integrase/recombinase XerD